MKLLKNTFLFLSLISFPCLSYAQNQPDVREVLDQRDIEALRDWVQTKRQVTVKETGGNLSISGEVRTELQSATEKVNGVKQRGVRGVTTASTRAYDVEVNVMFDYRADRTWATIKLEFDNNAGTVSGSFNHITLERAFWGVRIVNQDTYTIDMEVGRRRLSYTFDSRIQFGSFMDGMLFKYGQAFDALGDFYFHAGPFVVNEYWDHYAYVGEVALLNIGNTGLYSKYSFVDWDTKSYHGMKIDHRRFRFMNSQWIIGYKFVPKWLDKMVTFYAAGLMNHAARPMEVTRDKKKRLAAYIGFSAGEVRQKGDWSFDANLQWVQAQAISGFDVGGIGRGNVAGTGFYSTKPFGRGTLNNDPSQAAGNTNYRGFALELLYLFTNNLTLDQMWQQSYQIDDTIGPGFRYKQYEIELIYSF